MKYGEHGTLHSVFLDRKNFIRSRCELMVHANEVFPQGNTKRKLNETDRSTW